MNPENVRQLAWHFMDDERMSMMDLSTALNVPESRIIDFLYSGKYVDIDMAELFKVYLDNYYKERDAAINALLGQKSLDDEL